MLAPISALASHCFDLAMQWYLEAGCHHSLSDSKTPASTGASALVWCKYSHINNFSANKQNHIWGFKLFDFLDFSFRFVKVILAITAKSSTMKLWTLYLSCLMVVIPVTLGNSRQVEQYSLWLNLANLVIPFLVSVYIAGLSRFQYQCHIRFKSPYLASVSSIKTNPSSLGKWRRWDATRNWDDIWR